METRQVHLSRDTFFTPWGFRLQGGYDVGQPLSIQRVFIGSPSEGELHRGDIVLRIDDRDASRLSHCDATELIKNARTSLTLTVRSDPNMPMSPGNGPYSPGNAPFAGGPITHSVGLRTSTPAPYQTPATITVQRLPYGTTPPPTGSIIEENGIQYQLRQGFLVPEPLVEGKLEGLKEQAKIVNQTYRTTPLITPNPKARRDVVLGSYLRHVREPYFSTVQMPYDGQPLNPNDLIHRNTAPMPSNSFIPTPTPPNSMPSRQIVGQTYNSPIGLYSNKNASDAYSLHTGNQTPLPVGNKSPSDITLSPTYQMIHGLEGPKRSELQEQRGRVYYKPQNAQNGSVPGHPPQQQQQQDPSQTYNIWGSPKNHIHQSGSFKTIMQSVM